MDWLKVWLGHRNEIADLNYLIEYIRCNGRGYHCSTYYTYIA